MVDHTDDPLAPLDDPMLQRVRIAHDIWTAPYDGPADEEPDAAINAAMWRFVMRAFRERDALAALLLEREAEANAPYDISTTHYGPEYYLALDNVAHEARARLREIRNGDTA